MKLVMKLIIKIVAAGASGVLLYTVSDTMTEDIRLLAFLGWAVLTIWLLSSVGGRDKRDLWCHQCDKPIQMSLDDHIKMHRRQSDYGLFARPVVKKSDNLVFLTVEKRSPVVFTLKTAVSVLVLLGVFSGIVVIVLGPAHNLLDQAIAEGGWGVVGALSIFTIACFYWIAKISSRWTNTHRDPLDTDNWK